MKYIGAHVSIEGGVFNAPLYIIELGGMAFACFTKSQKRWFGNPYLTEDILKFKNNLTASGVLPQNILAHSGYLINLGNPDEKNRIKSINALIDEVQKCIQLGIQKIVIHPGSHLKRISEKECLDNISTSLTIVLSATEEVTLVIENTAGQGGNVGYVFEHLAYLIDKITDKNRIGVCIDTCHLFASGYDFRTKENYTEVWDKFNAIVGFRYLKGMHLNDSKVDLGSRIDRHESLGNGQLGLEPFKFLMQDSRFDNLPLILETADPLLWSKEIKLLYSMTDSNG